MKKFIIFIACMFLVAPMYPGSVGKQLTVFTRQTVSQAKESIATSSMGAKLGVAVPMVTTALGYTDPLFVAGAMLMRAFMGLGAFSIRQARLSTDQSQKRDASEQSIDLLHEKLACVANPEMAMDKLVCVEHDQQGNFIWLSRRMLGKYVCMLGGPGLAVVNIASSQGNDFLSGFEYGFNVTLATLTYKRYQHQQRLKKSQEYLDEPTNIYELAAALDEQGYDTASSNQKAPLALNASCGDKK